MFIRSTKFGRPSLTLPIRPESMNTFERKCRPMNLLPGSHVSSTSVGENWPCHGAIVDDFLPIRNAPNIASSKVVSHSTGSVLALSCSAEEHCHSNFDTDQHCSTPNFH